MGEIKDKEYVEKLFRSYKKNIARLEALELNQLTDEDYIINGVDYSSVNVQNSKIPTLDDIIITRDLEISKLKKNIKLVDIMLKSLDKRKDSQYRKVIENYYIENMTYSEVMAIIKVFRADTFFKICRRILLDMVEIIK